jgi:RIO kinase 1
MVKMWAEKEVRNLKRILQSGIKCPNPVILKGNIIVMEFIGKDGLAAPRLRDAKVTNWEKCYFDVVKIMRKMY